MIPFREGTESVGGWEGYGLPLFPLPQPWMAAQRRRRSRDGRVVGNTERLEGRHII